MIAAHYAGILGYAVKMFNFPQTVFLRTKGNKKLLDVFNRWLYTVD